MKAKILLLSAALIYASVGITNVSTMSSVCLTGAILQSQKEVQVEKYQRKNCPVCKGKGWYMSGDNIKKIECQYCEPENNTNPLKEDCCDTKIIKGS